MNIEKAIETLKMENELMQFDPNTGEDYPIELQNQDNQDLYNANLIAISALEKQIPKKPVIFFNEKILYCPSCTENVNKDDWYCSQCGQKIDWEEENE